MKFLINNYSSHNQTEALYFNAGLNLIDGISSIIWHPQQISAYDIFDIIKPDYFITHVDKLPIDCLSYIKNNNSIELILNITGVSETNVNNIVSILKEHNIKSAFFFTNSENNNIKIKNINIVNINFGADIFYNIASNKLNYRISNGVFINSKSQIKNMDGTYHYLSNESTMQGHADITLPAHTISSLYKNYDNIVFKYFETMIPQVFYDAVFYGNKVFYEIDDKNLENQINDKFKKIFKIENNICDKNCVDVGQMKDIIINKHTCLHRLKSLLSQLPANEYVEKLQSIIVNQRINK